MKLKSPRTMGVAGIAAVVGIAVTILVATGDAGSDEPPLKVDVFAKQYRWSFGFPEEGEAFARNQIHVPLGRDIQFEFRSEDVGHAFWVPEWKLKEDIVPGTVTTATITPAKAGTFQVICTELCGIEHGLMRAKLVVEPPGKFQRWIGGLENKIPPAWKRVIRLDDELESLQGAAGSSD